MKALRWLVHEAKTVAFVTLYFAACFVAIILLKQLWLADYGIRFRGIATALVGALVTAKVVVALDSVPLSRRLQGLPGIVEVFARTAFSTTAVLGVMLLEKAFESRAEQGGVTAALANVLGHPDMPKLWADTIAVGLSFLAYSSFGVVVRAIGSERMAQLFLSRSTTVR